MKTFGIINFEGPDVKVSGLGDFRPVPAFSFLGRYRLIDVMISNMTNSGIENLQVYMNGETRSLIEHLGTGRHYNINSKTGKLQMLTSNPNDQNAYNHDINAFLYNIEAIEEVNAKYVVIAPSYIVYSIDFRKVIETHKLSKSDITIVYKPVKYAKQHYHSCDCINIGSDNRITKIETNDGKYKNRNISLETYVMERELFIDLIKKASETSSMYWLKNIIGDSLDSLVVSGYRISNEAYFICNLNDYYRANMEIKDLDTAKSLFHKDWPIHTRTNDTAPAYYSNTANVKNSAVANGTIIRGTVENSVIGRQVIIEKGAVVKDSILLPGCYIGKNVNVSYTIIDKKARVSNVKNLSGDPDKIFYVKRRDII